MGTILCLFCLTWCCRYSSSQMVLEQTLLHKCSKNNSLFHFDLTLQCKHTFHVLKLHEKKDTQVQANRISNKFLYLPVYNITKQFRITLKKTCHSVVTKYNCKLLFVSIATLILLFHTEMQIQHVSLYVIQCQVFIMFIVSLRIRQLCNISQVFHYMY